MSRPLQVSFVIAGALVCFGAGAWYAASRSAPATAAGTRQVLFYRDPMHPAYRSDKPGVAPDCGMELEPVYADALQPPPQNPGTVRIGPDKQQLIGIHTVAVERSAGNRSLRTAGRVAADETRIYRLTAAVDGWVLDAYSKVAGDLVTKGEPLLTYYTREFVGAEQAYLFALDSLDRFQQAGPVSEQQKASLLSQLRQATDQLRNLGMGEEQIADIARQRKVTQEVILRTPVKGYILARNVSLGLRFDRGLEFYRIADLDHIWIYAEIFENESKYLHPGATAAVLWQGRRLRARMAASPPQFDSASRTLRVRFEAENPGAVLRPDMFVDVELPLQLPEALTVPAEAVLDSGRRTIVYLDRGNGVFEPRQVETGWRFDDRVAIIRGLEPADRVVADGNFLLDSESRLQLAAAGASPSADERDPVCGMSVKSDQYSVTVEGRVWRFCSVACKRDFEAHPEKYTRRGA